jgi:hypothetical protein
MALSLVINRGYRMPFCSTLINILETIKDQNMKSIIAILVLAMAATGGHIFLFSNCSMELTSFVG